MKNKRYTLIALLASLSIVINIIENIFFPPLSFGIRFGLANTISLITINLFGIKEMLFIVLIRLTLGNLIKGTIFGTPFMISAFGLFLSSLAIIILKKFKSSIYFMSMISAIFHTLGQMIVVTYLYNEINILYLLPILIILSLATGFLTALISKEALKRIRY